jgi:hypothetical protein
MRKPIAVAIISLLTGLTPLVVAAQPAAVLAQGGVRYAAGGIGAEEREAMMAMRRDFNLALTFAVLRAGNYVADVDVELRDSRGAQVLAVHVEGPWLYARLPADVYQVRARYGEAWQARKVTVRERGTAESYFYWDDPAASEEGVRDRN